jgi:hypothetical protein
MVNASSSKADLMDRIRELEAENEMLQMMVHDLTAPSIILSIARKYPEIAKRWEMSA